MEISNDANWAAGDIKSSPVWKNSIRLSVHELLRIQINQSDAWVRARESREITASTEAAR